ncbi:MAG: HupE/UreJ family protein [Haliea sp.]
MNRRMRLANFAILLLAACLGTTVQAHRFAPTLLQLVELAPGSYNVVWKTPAQATSPVPLTPAWPQDCSVASASPAQPEGTGLVTSLQLHCAGLGGGGLVGQTLGVNGLAANQASVMLMLTLLDGRQYQQVLNAEQPRFTVPEEPGAGRVMTDYTVLGIDHIWTGIDHLLFVFGLLLLVGSNVRLLWTITAFTVGHSVTLSLVTLGFFDYPVALVEFTIAVSIFWLAVALSQSGERSLFRRHPWWLAGGFGLLHGMGFAGALAETGLPAGNVPLALLFFNIGIELGQIAFILLALLLWQSLRRVVGEWQAQLRPLPVYLLGALSALWCIERGLEVLA